MSVVAAPLPFDRIGDLSVRVSPAAAAPAVALPDWFDRTLDPLGVPYREQQLALWRAITGRDAYRPDVDEDTPEVAHADPTHWASLYADSDAAIAGGHLMALGHVLMRSGVGSGARILEYGAGFGQIALAFARLGHSVDTVDINPGFCRAVTTLSARYRVDLTAHLAPFGFNPAGVAGAYDLIFFYESFHHCLDFLALVPKLRAMLKPGGRVLLAGEPVFAAADDYMPVPWGIRMDADSLAIMRQRGWMELGFREDFLLDVFARAGFAARYHPCENSHWARLYVFTMLA